MTLRLLLSNVLQHYSEVVLIMIRPDLGMHAYMLAQFEGQRSN